MVSNILGVERFWALGRGLALKDEDLVDGRGDLGITFTSMSTSINQHEHPDRISPNKCRFFFFLVALGWTKIGWLDIRAAAGEAKWRASGSDLE